MTATTLTREIDLGPSIPRITVEMLSVPVEPTPCPACRGTGRGKGSDEYGWSKCEGCNNSEIGAPA